MNPTLDEFMAMVADNPNAWYRFGPGETQNYFEALMERHALVIQKFMYILAEALERGDALGYMDDDYRALWGEITGEEWTSNDD